MKIKKLLVVVLAVTLTIGSVITAHAEMKTINLASSGSGAKVITKTGNYKINNRGDYKYGWIKFKVPKTGTYKFTFSNLTYKGESEDKNNDDYLDALGSLDYNKRISFAIQTGSNKSGWENISFGENSVYSMVNARAAIYATYLYGGYDTLLEAADACENGEVSDSQLLTYLNGDGTVVDLTVKVKKGTILRLYTQGDKTKTICNLKIKKVK